MVILIIKLFLLRAKNLSYYIEEITVCITACHFSAIFCSSNDKQKNPGAVKSLKEFTCMFMHLVKAFILSDVFSFKLFKMYCGGQSCLDFCHCVFILCNK